MAALVLSTQNIQPRDVVEYWHDVVSKIYAPCNNILFGDEFFAQAELTEFGSSELSYISSRPVSYHRTLKNIKMDNKDDIFISVMLKGKCNFMQFEKHVEQSAGDILLHDSAYPYLYTYPSDYCSIFYKLPRSLLSRKMLSVNALGGTVISAQSPYAKAICAFLQTAYQVGPDLTDCSCSEFSEPISSILSTCLRSATEHEDKYHYRVLLNKIKLFMQENYLNETLSLSFIAEQQHISVRTLTRIFAEEGESPMSWLQSQRLQKAYQMIVSQPDRSITEIALLHCFNDLSHFSRVFRKRFGKSPRAVRNNI